MENQNRTCRICYSIFEENLIPIKELQVEILEALCIKMDVGLTESAVMCRKCQQNMEENFNFKATCIYTEDYITPFVKDKIKINLREIKHLNEDSKEFKDNDKDVCRLCMQCTDDNMTFSPVEKEQFEEFFPEINLKATISQVLCTQCYDSLRTYLSFAATCMEWEKKLHNYATKKKPPVSLEGFLQYLNNADYTEEFEDKCDITIEETDIKDLKNQSSFLDDQHHSSKIKMYKRGECTFETKHEQSLTAHVRVKHYDPSKIKMYKCEECTHQTKYKQNLILHVQVKHSDPSTIKMYKCDLCTFQTKHKNSLDDHVHCRHSDPSKIKMYKCEKCTFETKLKSNLTRHVHNVHFDISKMNIFKCEKCTVKTRSQRYLFQHIQRCYSDPSQSKMYKCEECTYETKLKDCLKKHVRLVHFDPSKIIMYKCEECTYVTKIKADLIKHVHFIHADPSKIKMYECSECAFKTKYKKNVSKHFRYMHSDPSTLKMYKCGKCIYETKTKSNLTKHVRNIHRAFPKPEFVKVEMHLQQNGFSPTS